MGQRFFNPTVALAFALMAVIVMMILPVPPLLLDVGLAVSFSLAILIFTVTLFVDKPLDFSSFPTVLLASLMLRLSLNVSSTKLIIGEGHTGTNAAGGVIEGFAFFIMGGNVFLGLVVFGVLLIVNFMVITKGATRMAEVGARFALDGMPGKQLAIDGDIAAGAISHTEAKERREREQQETTFFGSLDGASKFVKGDAIAGLLITLLNLVAGIVMGAFVHGMAFGDAFQTYAILTVGDGLVSQIPAVIISIASALLLARGGTTGATDSVLFNQLGRHPAALYSVAGLVFIFASFPGLPFLPFLTGSLVLAGLAYWKQRAILQQAEREKTIQPASPKAKPQIGDLLDVDDLHVEFASDLVNLVLDPGTGLDARILNMRRHVATNFGVILPEVRLSDNLGLPSGCYVIRIHGVEHARGELKPDYILGLLPDESAHIEGAVRTREPVYGAPAAWLPPSQREEAAIDGITLITPAEVLATHLLEIVKQNLSRLLTLKNLRRVLTEFTDLSDPIRAEANKRFLEELIPDKVPIDVLHSILRLLLEEQVSIRNLPLILESIAEGRLSHSNKEALCEYVRQRLGFQIISELKREDGTVPLIQLAPEWEDTFNNYQLGEMGQVADIALPPELFNSLGDQIASKVQESYNRGYSPGLVTNSHRRRFIKTLVKAKGISAPVLSFEEIGTEARPALVGVVSA